MREHRMHQPRRALHFSVRASGHAHTLCPSPAPCSPLAASSARLARAFGAASAPLTETGTKSRARLANWHPPAHHQLTTAPSPARAPSSQEWETYFGSTAPSLTDAEFQVIMDDLRTSGEAMVTILRCTKLAGQSTTGPTTVSSDDAAAAEAELAGMTLSDSRKEKVVELFKLWDVHKDGKIAYKTLNSTGVQVGPKEHKVLDDLGRMDTDGDEVVTLTEMMVFFGACSEVMSDDEFDTIMADMSDVASTTNGVAKMIAMTEQSVREAGIVSEGEEAEPPPELSAEREELVKALFEAFSPSVAEPIAIKSLEMDTKTNVGPAKESVLSNLIAMDSNGARARSHPPHPAPPVPLQCHQ